jgi:hypothetical protein
MLYVVLVWSAVAVIVAPLVALRVLDRARESVGPCLADVAGREVLPRLGVLRTFTSSLKALTSTCAVENLHVVTEGSQRQPSARRFVGGG